MSDSESDHDDGVKLAAGPVAGGAAAAAAAFLAASGAGGGAAKDKKKKDKKKKKPTGAAAAGAKAEEDGDGGGKVPPAEAAAPAAVPKQTAKGKAIAERLAKQRAEEARRKAEEEAEERRIKELEAAEEAARARIAEEKAEKKRRADEKKAKKKAEGTYKTKAQKANEARSKAALEAMIAAGIEVPGMMMDGGEEGGDVKRKPSQVNNRRKQGNNSKQPPSASPKDDIPLPSPPRKQDSASEDTLTVKSSIAEYEEVDEEQDDDLGASQASGKGAAASDSESGDDWDTVDVYDLVAKVKISNDDEEDLLNAEHKQEQEQLRLAGIRREKLEAERKAEEERRRAEEQEMQRVLLETEMRKENAKKARLAREEAARAERSKDNLRSPIICIMGHVDTGKTKLLDKIRQTNVQEGEAGGITQQIGATFFSQATLAEKIEPLRASKEGFSTDIRLPGMLIIDTPGHESFSNLRSRGSSLCDMAILVIDLMHGLEPQTVESLNLLRSKKTPFVVALNKIDRCYGWKATPDGAVRSCLEMQDKSTIDEFETRSQRIRVELMEKGLNAELYWENTDPSTTVSMVPTSAVTGEGVPDILQWLIKLTQERLTEQIMFMPNLLQCTVLEVKAIEGLGTTIDTIIVNGCLKENDKIVVCTLDGPVITNIRALLTPPPSRELRVKSEYIHHKEIYGAMGVKLCAQGVDRALAGTPIMVIGSEDDEDDIKEEVMRDMQSLMKMDLDTQGVLVQASTLGALEALLQFLRKESDPPIPVSSISIGPVYRRDVMRASIMLEKSKPEFAAILAFDVKVDPDARAYADETGVRIFTADIIYHLFDQFTAYLANLMETRRSEAQTTAVFPCICKIMPQHIFNKKDPIIVGMEVVEGTLRVGTPLCIPALDGMAIGRVTSIEDNHKQVQKLAKGGNGAVRIEEAGGSGTMTYGRQFDASSGSLYSAITRASIDALKLNFKSELTRDDLKLLVQLKKVFCIP